MQVPAVRRFRRSVERPEFGEAVERAAAGSASLYCTSSGKAFFSAWVFLAARVLITRSRKVPNRSAGGTGAQAASRGAVFPGTMR